MLLKPLVWRALLTPPLGKREWFMEERDKKTRSALCVVQSYTEADMMHLRRAVLLLGLCAILSISSGQFIQNGNQFSSGVNVRSSAPLGVCDGSTVGTLYFLEGSQNLLLCNGSQWNLLSVPLENQASMRDLVLCSGNGIYDYDTLTCNCSYNDENGYWGGKGCQICAEGFTGPGCTVDVDECSVNNGGCDHACVNLPGGHDCTCNSGYVLQPDGTTCVDVTAPVISLIGPSTLTLSTLSNYVELGYSATDNSNDAVTVNVVSTVVMTTPGTYDVTYSAVDSSGNPASVQRTVVVASGPSYTALYSSEMVLQRSPETPCVQGFDVASTTVQLFLNDISVGSAVADSSGHFSICVSLDSDVYGYGPHIMHVVGSNGARAYLEDVMLGDVFLCSGQSNMEQMLSTVFDAEIEYGYADQYNESIRIMKIQRAPVSSPLSGYDFPGSTLAYSWQRSSSDRPMSESSGSCCHSTLGFSGVCWTFGRKLFELRGQTVPIGLIDSNYGGTPIERWSTPSGLSSCGGTAVGDLYNGMINPILSYNVTGAIWYQGEANSGDPAGYECYHSALVEGWREAFGNDLSFAFVQLAGYEPGTVWPAFRLAQMEVLEVSKTGMATAVDLGEKVCESPPLCTGLIHPRQKRPLGERLALTMNGIEYGGSEEYHGPTVSTYGAYDIEYDNVGGIRFSFEIIFDYANYGGLGTHGTFDCTTCCANGAVTATVGGAQIPQSSMSVQGNRISFNVTNFIYGDATIDVKHAHAAFPECVLDDSTVGIAAPPFHLVTIPGDPCANPENATAFARCNGGSWEVLYDLDIPYGSPKTQWTTFSDIPYSVDNGAILNGPCGSDIIRIGYHLQLDDNYGFVSMAPFTTNNDQFGVPIDWSFVQEPVEDLFFASNLDVADGFSAGTNGTLEFFSNCYQVGSGNGYDAVDSPAEADCYGSMQVHDADGFTLFAFNRWATAAADYDIGIGTASSGHPDWTFSRTSTSYTTRRLRVLVQRGQPAPATASSSCDAIRLNNPGATSGIYSVSFASGGGARDVYCDMSTQSYGPGFTRLFHHNIGTTGGWGYTGFERNVNDANSDAYAILSNLGDMRGVCGYIEMRLNWPGEASVTGFNRWAQLSNPVTDAPGALPVGYTPLDIQYTDKGWGGLQRSAHDSSLLDGTLYPLKNWYYAIASRNVWNGAGTPGPVSAVQRTELWARPYYPSSCLEYFDHGYTVSQVYTIRTADASPVLLDVYCDMTSYGGGWTRVGYHSIQDGLWPNDENDVNADNPLAPLYSILSHLEGFRRDGKFEFIMRWPDNATLTGVAQWTQTSNPMPETAGTAPTGYVNIRLDHAPRPDKFFGGLMKSTQQGNSFLDCMVDPIGNWFYAFGGRSLWEGAIPGPSDPVQKVELLVR